MSNFFKLYVETDPLEKKKKKDPHYPRRLTSTQRVFPPLLTPPFGFGEVNWAVIVYYNSFMAYNLHAKQPETSGPNSFSIAETDTAELLAAPRPAYCRNNNDSPRAKFCRP